MAVEAALIGGGGNLLGGIIDYYGAAAQSHRGRQFAREMASTQYQRAVADMKAAGLNPLAIFGNGGGSPAAVPQGDFSARSNFSNAGSGFVEGWSKGEAQVALQAQSKIAQANARVAESDADVKLAENSALMQALRTPWGPTAVVHERYGKLGAAGEVLGSLGIGNWLGGENSARSSARNQVLNEALAEREAAQTGKDPGWLYKQITGKKRYRESDNMDRYPD